MTVPQLLQLYAPLAGMLVLAFTMGTLFSRVGVLERERKDDKAAEVVLAATKAADHDTLILVAADVTSIKDGMAGIHRDIAGMQRQFANMSKPQAKTYAQEDEYRG